jgi:hypothetical protein
LVDLRSSTLPSNQPTFPLQPTPTPHHTPTFGLTAYFPPSSFLRSCSTRRRTPLLPPPGPHHILPATVMSPMAPQHAMHGSTASHNVPQHGGGVVRDAVSGTQNTVPGVQSVLGGLQHTSVGTAGQVPFSRNRISSANYLRLLLISLRKSLSREGIDTRKSQTVWIQPASSESDP